MGLKCLGASMLTMLCLSAPVQAQERYIVVASTTSTQDSGLFKYILPLFKARTGVEVRVVAQGTGQALATARKGDADVVFVHDAVAEKKFVDEGFGLDRREVMYNDFVLVGPKSDPAAVSANKNVLDAFKRIASSASAFTSRGDKSGTHAAELRYWATAQIDPTIGKGTWYRETGSGMGPTLNTASAMNAYSFTDRGTWLSFKNRGELTIVLEGDQRLFNQYGVMRVHPGRHPHVKTELAQLFIDWITSSEGQAAIANFKIDGQQLFFPNFAAVKKAA
jgi:tungstate transport system substrate-binding protein